MRMGTEQIWLSLATLLAQASARQRRDEPAGRAGDLPLDTFAAQRPAPVGGAAHRLEERRLEPLAKQRPVRLLAFSRIAAERAVERMIANERVGGARCVGAIARPRIVPRARHHAGAHRIELDVAAAGEEVRLAV